MKIKIIDIENSNEKAITIIRVDNGFIHPKGWMFPCLICCSMASRIRRIKTRINDGIVRSIICKDCQNKDYVHEKPHSHYLKYRRFYKLKNIYQN